MMIGRPDTSECGTMMVTRRLCFAVVVAHRNLPVDGTIS
jgi:hypothetical protein